MHHAILNRELFDRIISINKDIFTTIQETMTSNGRDHRIESLLNGTQ